MIVFVAVLVAGGIAASAGVAQPPPLSVFNGAVACSTQPSGIVFCGSQVAGGQSTPVRTLATSWDGTAIDVNFAMPQATAQHHGPYPLVILLTGIAGFKYGLTSTGGRLGAAFESMTPWLQEGYATLSFSYRGFNESCGTAASLAAIPAPECAAGFDHFMDTRYDVRDAQYLAGELVDEGLVSPTRIAAWGGSWGAGAAMTLAALKNRVMLPDARLVPWTSPNGTKMSLAASAPFSPWTDLAYAMFPNGSTLDYVANAPYRGRFGVKKDSYVDAVFGIACGNSVSFCTTTNVDWNFGLWAQRIDQGEPYSGSLPAQILHQLEAYHSAYSINPSEPPAPVLIASGFTDPLFPVSEAVRYDNRTTTQYPNAPVSLYLGDWGHLPAQFKDADISRWLTEAYRWVNYYVKGEGPKPYQGVEALTETCPFTAPSAGPYRAPSWAALQPGEVRLSSPRAQTILPTAGSLAIGEAFSPLQAKACATAPAATQPGTATYRLAVRHAFTMMGAPTVIADFKLPGANSEVAARLLDVAPGGRETLISRGLWRPAVSSRPVRQVFQLTPGAWRFGPGHSVKLELLPNDEPYGRPADGQAAVTVSNLQLRIPTADRPGAAAGAVQKPLPKVVPPGYKLAREFARLPAT